MPQKIPTLSEWLIMREHPYHKLGLEANFAGQKYKEPHLPIERMGELGLNELLDELHPCTGGEYHLLSCGLLINTPGHVEPCGQTCFWNDNPVQSPAPFFCIACRDNLVRKFSLFFPSMRFHNKCKDNPAWKTHPLRRRFFNRWDFQDARKQCMIYERALRSKLRFPGKVLGYEDLKSEINSRTNDGEVELGGPADEIPDPYAHLNFATLPNKRTMEHWATQQMVMKQLPIPRYEGHFRPKAQVCLQRQRKTKLPSAVLTKRLPALTNSQVV
jgi:hypothetical protein